MRFLSNGYACAYCRHPKREHKPNGDCLFPEINDDMSPEEIYEVRVSEAVKTGLGAYVITLLRTHVGTRYVVTARYGLLSRGEDHRLFTSVHLALGYINAQVAALMDECGY